MYFYGREIVVYLIAQTLARISLDNKILFATDMSCKLILGANTLTFLSKSRAMRYPKVFAVFADFDFRLCKFIAYLQMKGQNHPYM